VNGEGQRRLDKRKISGRTPTPHDSPPRRDIALARGYPVTVWVPRVVVVLGLLLGAWTGSAPEELLQGRVASVDRVERTLRLDVYLAGTDVPRFVSRAAVVSVDGRTRFRPGPGDLEDLRPGDDVLVRVAADGRAGEITLVDVD
jgi:hypothetical protein